MLLIDRKRGFTLVEVIVTIGIIMLLAAITIPNVLKTRTVANEAAAKAALHTIGNAIEMYMAINSNYPSSEAEMLSPNSNPPYLNQAFDGQSTNGYQYVYQFNGGYTVTATPDACGTTGTKIFTLSQNKITEAACSP